MDELKLILTSQSHAQIDQMRAIRHSLASPYKIDLHHPVPQDSLAPDESGWKNHLTRLQTDALETRRRVVVLSREYFSSYRCMAELTLFLAQRSAQLPVLLIHGFGSFDEAKHCKYGFLNDQFRCELGTAVLHLWKIIVNLVDRQLFRELDSESINLALNRMESEVPCLTLPDTYDLSNALVADIYQKLASRIVGRIDQRDSVVS